jgi:hypothetical protein
VSGLSAARIKQALKQWQADSLPQAYHRLTLPSKDLKLILSAFHIPHIPNLPTSVQLKQLKYSFDKACVM